MNVASSSSRPLPDGSAAPAPGLGGWVPFSTVDWPGQIAAVAFVAGCPWRCGYCHNPHLQARDAALPNGWADFLALLERRRGLLDGVVFSGGEPLIEPLLPQMAATVKAMGFRVGLHTAGIYPRRLANLLPQLDWVGLDIKTDAAGYAALTGRRFSATPVATSLRLLLERRVAFECRTTWDANLLSESALLDLAQDLAAQGVHNYAVQACRGSPGDEARAGLAAETGARLQHLFSNFSWR